MKKESKNKESIGRIFHRRKKRAKTIIKKSGKRGPTVAEEKREGFAETWHPTQKTQPLEGDSGKEAPKKPWFGGKGR